MSESTPFTSLGKHLRYVREQSQESLAEVSGAVEIEEQTLARIEAGEERPTEDILLLLISHFGVQDQEAVHLWELADYSGELPDQLRADIDVPANAKVVMLLAMDMRTMYSDGLDITSGPAGLTLNFTQVNAKQQPNPVARVGMSYEQAQLVLTQLGKALLTARYNKGLRGLPPGSMPNSGDDNHAR